MAQIACGFVRLRRRRQTGLSKRGAADESCKKNPAGRATGGGVSTFGKGGRVTAPPNVGLLFCAYKVGCLPDTRLKGAQT